MTEQFDDDGPLPQDWLPEATAAADAPEWERRVARIVAAAEACPTTATTLGAWWKVAAVLAAAVALTLVLTPRDEDTATLPLAVIAVGLDAHPVLAMLAVLAVDPPEDR
jgi:hypothetical protein